MLYAKISPLARLPYTGPLASRVREPQSDCRKATKGSPAIRGLKKVRANYTRKVMVEGKGFVFASPLTSRHLSSPTLQIAAKRGKTRARTRHALCGGWDVELARRAPPPLSLNRFSAAV